MSEPIKIVGPVQFKLRFNTAHGETDFFWRVIIDDTQYLARSIDCQVPTQSDASFDKTANCIKYHIAGTCNEMLIDEEYNLILK